MVNVLLLTALLSAPNTAPDTAKHVGAGAFCSLGVTGMTYAYTDRADGSTLTLFGVAREIKSGNIAPATVAGFVVCSAAYFAKEAIIDPNLYGSKFDTRDYAEGQAGVAVGSAAFLPLWSW